MTFQESTGAVLCAGAPVVHKQSMLKLSAILYAAFSHPACLYTRNMIKPDPPM